MAFLLRDMGQSVQAVDYFRQSVVLKKQIQHPEYLQDVEVLAQWESALANGKPLPDLPPETGGLPSHQVQTIAANTLFVLTDAPEQRSQWHEAMVGMLQEAQLRKRQAEIEFSTAILTLLDRKIPNISAENPYAGAIQAILQRLSAPANPPALPADFVARCVGGLAGGMEQKMSLADELAAMAKASADGGALALIDTVQRALFGAPLESLGQGLSGAQAQVWQEILSGLE
jgi:hypothetical protein